MAGKGGMMLISFTPAVDIGTDKYNPYPAASVVPDWYKKMDNYIGGNERMFVNGSPNATVKRCVPVADAMNAGYIIPTSQDVFVTEETQLDGSVLPYFSWSLGVAAKALDFHPIEQAPLHPLANGNPFPKWINPWSIKTPPGFSVLFCQPMHRDNEIFTILPGIVDTDTYTNQVNFPFQLNDPSFRGLIPAGTPICQVIPFRRDSWQMEIGSAKDFAEDGVMSKLRRVMFNSYKTQFWSKKDFR